MCGICWRSAEFRWTRRALYRWVQKFGLEIHKRTYGRHRSWRGLQWHVDETYVRVNGRWCYDQRGQLIDFRLTARRNANAARAFMRQARETVRLYQPMMIITDKAQCYAKVIKELNRYCDPGDAIRHVDRKHLNNRIESDHGALKQLLRPKRSFRRLSSAKNTPKGIETFRSIKKGHFENNRTGVQNEITFVAGLFAEVA